MGDYVINRSSKSDKKYVVTDSSGKSVHFGYAKAGGDGEKSEAEDFTMHKDPERWRRYLKRHGDDQIDINDDSINPENYQPTVSTKEDWSIDGVNTAGFWSRWYSWSYPDIDDIKKDMKKRFGINLTVDFD